MRDAGRVALLVAGKELRHLRHDRRSQALTLALPVVAMVAFSFSFGGQDLSPAAQGAPFPMVVQDLDRSLASRELVEILHGTGLFVLHVVPHDRDVVQYMREKEAFAALVLPEGFGEAMRSGAPILVFHYDDTKPYVGTLTLSRVKLVLDAVAREQGRGVEFRFEGLATPSGRLDVFTPGIVVLLVAFTSLNDIASSLTRERSEGTLGRVWLAPVSRGAFLAGKVLAGLALVLLRAVVLLAVAVLAFGLAFRGSLVAYLLLALLAGAVTLGLGVLLAARARTEREVMVATLMTTVVLMFMMGAITPVDLMVGPARVLAAAIPHTHAADAMRRVMLLGEDVGDVLPTLGLLAAVAALFLAVGARAFHRELD